MGFGLGKINGFKFSGASLSGFSETFDRVVFSAEKIKAMKTDTIRSCKPFRPECEFCKEKLNLLNDDVFTKTSKDSKVSK